MKQTEISVSALERQCDDECASSSDKRFCEAVRFFTRFFIFDNYQNLNLHIGRTKLISKNQFSKLLSFSLLTADLILVKHITRCFIK